MKALAITICPTCNIKLWQRTLLSGWQPAHFIKKGDYFCPKCLQVYTLIDEQLAPEERKEVK